jgi:Spy/CpxP family protein refolding chaperone
MTLRCSRSRSGQFSIATALSLLFMVTIGLAPVVVAQDTPGAQPKQGNAPDADFGVMQGQPSDDSNNSGPPMRQRPFRQRFDGDGAFGGGRMGGGRMGGMGQGRMGGMGEGGIRGGRMGGLRGGHHALDLTPLNLNEDQKNRIKQIRQSTRERARTTKQSLMQKQLQLRDLLFSADASDAKIRAARKEVRQAQEQLDDLNIEDLLKIRSVLTAEQKQKLPDLKPNPAGARAQLGDRLPAGHQP